MFGHQDDQPAQQDSDAVSDKPVQEAQNSDVGAATITPAEPATKPQADTEAASGDAPDNAVKADEAEEVIIKPDQGDQPQEDPKDDAAKAETPAGDDWQNPGVPADTPSEQEPIRDVISPAGGFPKRPTFQYPAALTNLDSSGSIASDQSDNGGQAGDEELFTIKQQALGELSPLIEKLDLPPEEKFRTIMMIIQAGDDESLVKAAYDSAHAIEDEKTRAQALLDIVNEVNYFTQPPAEQPEESAD